MSLTLQTDTPQFVQTGSGSSAKALTFAVHDVLLAAGFCYSPSAFNMTTGITDTAGNTWTPVTSAVGNAFNASGALWACLDAKAGASTVTVTGNGGTDIALHVRRYSNPSGDVVTIDDFNAHYSSSDGGVLDAGGLTPKAVSDLLAVFGGTARGGSVAWTAGTGYGNVISDPDTTHFASGSEDRVSGATGSSYTTVLNHGASDQSSVVLAVALKITPRVTTPVINANATVSDATHIVGLFDASGAASSIDASKFALTGQGTLSGATLTGTVSGGTTNSESFTLTLSGGVLPPGATAGLTAAVGALHNANGSNSSATISLDISHDTTPIDITASTPFTPTGPHSATITFNATTSSFAPYIAIATLIITPADLDALNNGDSVTLKYQIGGVDSAVADTWTFEFTDVTAPTLNLQSVSAGSLTVNWSDATGGVAPYTYDMYINGVLHASNVTSPCVSVGLSPGTSYSIFLRVTDSSAATDDSNTVTTSTTCASPTLISISPGNTVAAPTWNAVTGAVTYNVYVDGSLAASGITETTTALTGLTNGQSYAITVKAIGANGQLSGDSNSMNVTPSAPAPYTGKGHKKKLIAAKII